MSNRFLLEAKNIIKTFPPTVALNDVHFCLRPGEIHGLMGENGSGKSTMCSIVSGIYPYDSGELFLDGEPYCPKNMIDAAAKGVCMIVQEQGTFASTTVAENIAGCMLITFILAQEMIVPITTRIRDAYKAGDKKTANKLWDKLVDDYMCMSSTCTLTGTRPSPTTSTTTSAATLCTKCGSTVAGPRTRSAR